MELIRKYNNASVSAWFMCLVALSGLFFISQVCHAEISTDAYCQLTLESLQQQIQQTQDLISIVNQYKDDSVTLNQQLEAKRAEFDEARESLYSSYGITAQAFVTYMDRNSAAVKAYLQAHPDINQQINDLSAQLNTLMEQEDALMAPDSTDQTK